MERAATSPARLTCVTMPTWRSTVGRSSVQYSWFGQAFVVLSAAPPSTEVPLLLVGALGARDANGTTGRVYAFAMGAGAARTPPVLFTVTGDEALAEFGRAAATATA